MPYKVLNLVNGALDETKGEAMHDEQLNILDREFGRLTNRRKRDDAIIRRLREDLKLEAGGKNM